MAERQGLVLHKSRRRDPRALGYGRWEIRDENGNAVAGESAGRPTLTLGQVERHLLKGTAR
jgi:hypothetical protein